MSSLQSHESSFGEQEHVSSTDSLSVSTSLSSSPENTSDLNDQDSDVAMTMDTQEPGDPPSASTFITPNEQPDEQNQTLPTPASDTAEPATSIKPKTKKGLKSQQSQSQQQPQQSKKKAAAPAPLVRLPGPLPALPKSTPLPYLEDFQLLPEQLKNPLFIAISKVLLVYGNAWQSANDLVDGIRHFNLANLGGRTPKGTVQGAISTALALSSALGTFDPIEKQRMNSTTYYRMSVQTLEESADVEHEDGENGTDSGEIKQGAKATASRDGPKKISASKSSGNQRKRSSSPESSSDSMSSDSSDDEDEDFLSENGTGGTDEGTQSSKPSSGLKRLRTASPGPSTSKLRTPTAKELPNGMKKLPKGYVYDMETDPRESPSEGGQFGENMEQFREREYPDRRADFGTDLTQEPSMFALEQQIGYTYPRLRTSRREKLAKLDCEDGFAIADLKFSGGYLGRLFCITDGHGGRACSSYVIATIPGAMQVILGKYHPSDLSKPNTQESIKAQIIEAVRVIDKEYLDYKKQQYLLYKAKKLQHDPGSDGTTLIINIFIDKWIICVNLGDSRSILSSRDITGRWNVDFSSEDHTPSLERIAQNIYANGGEFVTHDDKVIRFDPAFKNDKKHRSSLREARIRVKDGASNVYGIPFRTRNGQAVSVNLGACVGDVLYKLNLTQPILSNRPDITFIDVSDIQQGYLLIASDGLWDYVLRDYKDHEQISAVCQYVGDKIDRGWSHQRIVATLSDRESVPELYTESIHDFDDFTAILVVFNNQHQTQETDQQQKDQQQSQQQPPTQLGQEHEQEEQPQEQQHEQQQHEQQQHEQQQHEQQQHEQQQHEQQQHEQQQHEQQQHEQQQHEQQQHEQQQHEQQQHEQHQQHQQEQQQGQEQASSPGIKSESNDVSVDVPTNAEQGQQGDMEIEYTEVETVTAAPVTAGPSTAESSSGQGDPSTPDVDVETVG